jgi:hypothetical protein
MKIATVADVPDELGNAWLQHLRDFDAAHPGCHFQVMASAPKLNLREIAEMLEVNPSLDLIDIIQRNARSE